ncbi:GNAT family N-acetyltransferase [Dendrosporobacter quercicolus]|uniref:GNAT family N-acetyltransferase n=1 Tax=Dendrosporobacter quercicolus TaxID=146817 RepID=UPI001C314E77|nr:GNAT family N-acetyltransferase [Dendrosporobacter quercicolus]
MDTEIRKIGEQELSNVVNILRVSFNTVAAEFNLTKENAATNAAFIEIHDLLEMKKKDIDMLGLYLCETQIGFVAVEETKQKTYYMEKLSILPKYRHKGYGKKLMDYVFKYVKRMGGEKVSIGIINQNYILKNWYLEYGFIEKTIKKYPHLCFEVCLMEKKV